MMETVDFPGRLRAALDKPEVDALIKQKLEETIAEGQSGT